MMIRRLLGLLRKEVVQFLRDRVVLFLILYLYTIEAIMCTRALTFEIKQLPIAVVDQDLSVASRHLVDLFTLTEAFDLRRQSDSPVPLREWLEAGDIAMALVIPTGFEQSYQTGIHPSVQILLDGTNSNVAENARRYALAIVERFAAEQPPLAATATMVATVPVTRTWYNPNQETAAFMVLSMMALAAMLVGAICPAASIVRERERGTIEQLLVTPIRVGEMFAAKTVPTLIINLLAIAPALVVTRLFDVPIRGSLATFVVLAAVFQLSAIAFGVFIASMTRTLQQALLLAFFGLFPILFLSGTLTSIEAMPRVLQAASLVSPLRYYMEIILGVFLKGAGWAELWPQAAALAVIGSVLFALSLLVFRRRLG
ncbi:MAG TPA: ABC transporter permease [Gammaproteobacteria bacterium]|nr:ABC transporter permease [Gammaproteobacteria bacterium]